jgi:Tfp pilus assembly PilM family ATPase
MGKTQIALDITDTGIRALLLQGNKIVNTVIQPVPEGLIKDGIITDSHSTAIIIDNLFKSAKLSKNKVICALNALPFIYRTLTMPPMPQKLVVDAVEREAKRELAISDDEMHLIWEPIETHEETKEVEYFIMAVPRTALNPLLETLEMAGIKPELIDIKPLAVARAAGLKDAIIVSLEKHYIDIVIVNDGKPRVIHSLTPNAYPEDAAGIASDFSDGLSKAIKFYKLDYSEPITEDIPIVLCGELADNQDVQNYIQGSTGYPVSVFTTNLTAPEDFNSAIFAGAVGLAIKNTRLARDIEAYHDINIDLLFDSSKLRPFHFNYSYVVAALVIIAFAFLVYQTYQMKNEADERVAELQNQAAVISQKLDKSSQANKNLNAEYDKQNNNLSDLKASLSSVRLKNQFVSGLRVDYSSRIIAITGAMPEDIHYSLITMNPDRVKFEGSTEDLYSILNFNISLEADTYFDRARIERIDVYNEETGTFDFETQISNSSAQ